MPFELRTGGIVALKSGGTHTTYMVKRVVTGPCVELVDTIYEGNPDAPTIYMPEQMIYAIPHYKDEADVWTETALLIGLMVKDAMTDAFGEPCALEERDTTNIRRKCYILLGGNKIKVVEETKEQVRTLIERAVARVRLLDD